MDATTILSVPSSLSRKKTQNLYDLSIHDAKKNMTVTQKYGLDENEDDNSDNKTFINEFLDFHNTFLESLSDFSKNCVANIGSWVVKK